MKAAGEVSEMDRIINREVKHGKRKKTKRRNKIKDKIKTRKKARRSKKQKDH